MPLTNSQLVAEPYLTSIQHTGPSNRRIDLVLLAEGYTHNAAFVADATRLVDDAFHTPDGAFTSMSSLYNIHAVHTTLLQFSRLSPNLQSLHCTSAAPSPATAALNQRLRH